MNDYAGAEACSKVDEIEQRLAGTLAGVRIERGEIEPLGRHGEPVQAGNEKAMAFDDPPRFRSAQMSGDAEAGTIPAMLGIDEATPPADAATVGGMVAAGLAGPARAAVGSVRDFVLGATMLNGRAEVLTFGGQVMKNVAGYDVSRLIAGSLGTLGVITEVSLKVLPRPATECTLRLEMPESRAIEAMNRWAGQPLPISATGWQGGILAVRLSGAPSALREGAARLGGERSEGPGVQAFWQGIREQTDPFFAGADPLWRVSVPTLTAPLGLPGAQLIEWNGGLRWLRTSATAAEVREAAHKAGGHATIFRGSDRSAGVFSAISPGSCFIRPCSSSAWRAAATIQRPQTTLSSSTA